MGQSESSCPTTPGDTCTDVMGGIKDVTGREFCCYLDGGFCTNAIRDPLTGQFQEGCVETQVQVVTDTTNNVVTGTLTKINDVCYRVYFPLYVSTDVLIIKL